MKLVIQLDKLSATLHYIFSNTAHFSITSPQEAACRSNTSGVGIGLRQQSMGKGRRASAVATLIRRSLKSAESVLRPSPVVGDRDPGRSGGR
jgi:hypothetical protein